MSTPATSREGTAATEGMRKLIRGVGIAELILGFLCMAIAVFLGPGLLRRYFPADAPFWTSLTSTRTLSTLGLIWSFFLAAFVMFFHGPLCLRMQRPLRPIGFAIGVLVALKFMAGLIVFVAMKLVFNSLTVMVNGNTANLGELIGVYVDFLMCAEAVILLLAVSLAAFCGSKETKKALESLDQARYQMDAIPLSVFTGIVLFIYLAYSSLTAIIHPAMPFAGLDLSPLLQRMIILPLSAGFILTAVAFYRGRSWGWMVALLLGLVWTAMQFGPSDNDLGQLSGPEFDNLRSYIPLAKLLMQRLGSLNDVFTSIGLVLFVSYLFYVRRHLTDKPYERSYLKSSQSDVSFRIDWHSLGTSGRNFIFMAALGGMQWSTQNYFLAIVFFLLALMWVLLAGIALVVPRYVFREAGLAIPGFSLLVTPVFPYESFKAVRFITTKKAPKGIRSIEDGVLNLNVSMFDDARRAELEKEFRKRNVGILPSLVQTPS